MQYRETFVPSEKQANLGLDEGLTDPDALALMSQDYISVNLDQVNGTGNVVVGDFANNFPGFSSSFASPEHAAQIGLPEGYQFNGGHLASLVMRERLAEISATGSEFIAAANGVLRELYVDLGMISSGADVADTDPPARFTGYLSQVSISPGEDPESIIVTSVGDVMVWADGVHVAGVDGKPIDNRKGQLTKDLAAAIYPYSDITENEILKLINTFAGDVGLPDTDKSDLLKWVRDASSQDFKDFEDARQTAAYLPVDTIATLDQIRRLQNPQSQESGPYHYAAVDGTHTLESGITVVRLGIKDIGRIVVASDGLRPKDSAFPVMNLEDLQATNPKYGDQAAVEIIIR